METIETDFLTEKQKAEIIKLWNAEYPESLFLADIESFEKYLNELSDKKYYLTIEDNKIQAFTILFERDDEKWFALIVSENNQRKGIGRKLLEVLKFKNEKLCGWVIDGNNYKRTNGEAYNSPLEFYLKNDFNLIPDKRLHNEKIDAVKIEWSRITSR